MEKFQQEDPQPANSTNYGTLGELCREYIGIYCIILFATQISFKRLKLTFEKFLYRENIVNVIMILLVK